MDTKNKAVSNRQIGNKFFQMTITFGRRKKNWPKQSYI